MSRTLEALGLKHPHDVVVHQDSPSLRGQIKRVRHLVTIAPAKDEA
ncbi:MAG: 50S ribosomal protein L30 [Gemmatimonadota bacterium]|nr:50S ribosomal protein L30 [Gemmatimonadota bacterium]